MNHHDYEKRLALHEVSPGELRSEFDAETFSFETTEDMGAFPYEMIGQERAERAMEFGLSVKQTGYNLFVVGPTGTGRMTYTQHSVENLARTQERPDDWCYVHNFDDPDRPEVLSFKAGEGQRFRREIEQLLLDIERELRTAFSSDSHERQKREMFERLRAEMDELWKETDQFAVQHHFKLERMQNGINKIPLQRGQPMNRETYQHLLEAEKEHLRVNEKLVEEKVQDALRRIARMEENFRKEVQVFMADTASAAVQKLFEPLHRQYGHMPKVTDYLTAYEQDVVEHFYFFAAAQGQESSAGAIETMKEKQYQRYVVNLLVNNRHLDGAPVVYESNPTYHNLFGKVEYQGQIGSLVTNFTFIKPGAVHLANGGYLILQAADLLQHPGSWPGLKRMLQTGHVHIENSYEERGLLPASALKPEPIPFRTKVIIIGSYYIYDLLSRLDEEFDKLFKVKVEFDTVMAKSDENSWKMAGFVKNYIQEEGLLPFHREAVARVIDYSSRLVDEQGKMTTRFQDITKLLVESSHYALQEREACVKAAHVFRALEEKYRRSSHIPEQYRERIYDETIMIQTEGYRVGQINGLAVMGTRDSMFGIPTKITAQTYVGKSGLMNIERETSLSGQIHHKGMMILTGFLSGQFAKNRPIPLSASITFEQTYNLIDGDSASSTELYVLLSSLAEVPIYQGIAVTGSVNQWGEIQPIGGVNEKIEGFFQICREKGLNGRQGVIIPKQNARNLMLDPEVVEAAEAGSFHVWAVGHISEGMEILTGERAGAVRREDGTYPEGSVFARTEARFNRMYEVDLRQQKIE
ncbi:ATP-dependent protease [Marinococcus halophilus]|uniref:endopeptidase La n=1 Tax=Marinococcus halophilus TaxID=1371 RepID=A0A510Y9J0_MARHA|nr:ATP-binding protein [Marinococcus halophilus]OZT78990.1 ATP-dependent protease [Marinococcus halophilus]GEK60025.1 ATP-dependent protease [Marinococcus halophilus]